jgi:hypothetical protein
MGFIVLNWPCGRLAVLRAETVIAHNDFLAAGHRVDIKALAEFMLIWLVWCKLVLLFGTTTLGWRSS